MPKINLEEEDLKKLFEALNEGYEPPGDLIGKLFPSFFEKLKQDSKFDFQELIRHKIPTLEYAGKRQEGVILASASIVGQSGPLQVVRTFGESGEEGWRNMIVQGDNLQFLKTVFLNQDPLIKDKVKGKVKLIYIDPPFGTKSDFQSKEGGTGYSDKVQSAEFLENMRERLIFMREVLSDEGSIYLHCDWRMNSALRLIMDEVFGPFENQITWKRSAIATNVKTQWRNSQDFLLFYSISGRHTFNPQFGEYTESSIKHYNKKDEKGVFRTVPLMASGRTSGVSGQPWRGIDVANRGKSGMHWLKNPEILDDLDKQGKIYWNTEGIPELKYYLDVSSTVGGGLNAATPYK